MPTVTRAGVEPTDAYALNITTDQQGIVDQTMGAISDAIGGLQSIVGGRVGAYVKLAESARQEAYEALLEDARGKGANAILAMRYDANEIMPGITEVLAYGTAMVVEPE